jgi:glycosyltransferase involved in cell wall biosynthesis
MTKTLKHLPLEPYRQRYTELLKTWEQEAFSKQFNVQTVEGDTSSGVTIRKGEVLDCNARPIWAMTQIQALINMPDKLGAIYFSDFFHPGLEALPYSRHKFKSAAFLWAQTFDMYDFTCQFKHWMRPWEYMAFDIYDVVFVACEELKELIGSAMPNVDNKVIVTGLPFSSKSILGMVTVDSVVVTNCPQVIYSSRWDTEKNPGLFLDVVERCPGVEFGVCTGWPALSGSDRISIARAEKMASKPRTNLRLYTDLSKERYYGILSAAKMQFNCAYQDWISYTLLEALTFGCIPIYPAYRSFPAALSYEDDFLYVPGSADDAAEHVRHCLAWADIEEFKLKLSAVRDAALTHNDGSLGRITDVLANL